MNANAEQLSCPHCDFAAKSRQSLYVHCAKSHGKSGRELFIELNLAGVAPACATAGCMHELRFNGPSRGFEKKCKSCRKLDAIEKYRVARTSKHAKAWNSGLTKETSAAVARCAQGVKAAIACRGGSPLRGRTKETHGYLATAARRRSETQILNDHRGSRHWSFGLTKESDERIARRAKAIRAGLSTSDKVWWKRPDAEQVRQKIAVTRRELLESGALVVQGHAAWNKGLTKETDERLTRAAAAISLGQLARHAVSPSWQTGLTKETDERVARIGAGVHEHFQAHSAWSKGLTKETDARLARISSRRLLPLAEVQSRLESSGFTVDVSLQYVGSQVKIPVTCMTCGTIQEKTVHSVSYGSRCVKCFPPWASRWQLDVFQYVVQRAHDVVLSDRSVISPFEIDVFVPSRKFGIECNGLYWHSTAAGCDDGKHDEKSTMANDAGVLLMHLFEDEWRYKRNIVESMIDHRLGLSRRISARSTTIEHVDRHTMNAFFESNHLDGTTTASDAFGLFEPSGTLVACLSLRRTLVKDEQESQALETREIARFACKAGTAVIGGLTRLTKRASQHLHGLGVKRLLTYADRRLGCSHAYGRIGFKHVRRTGPRFWWTDFDARFNRFKFRARAGFTEAEVAQQHGVHKIWGCSNDLYEMRITG